MTKLKRNASDTTYYQRAASENRAIKNRTHKLKKHLKEHPEDKQAQAALDKGLHYRRKVPNKKVWTPQKKWYAEMLSSVGLDGNIALAEKKPFLSTTDDSV